MILVDIDSPYLNQWDTGDDACEFWFAPGDRLTCTVELDNTMCGPWRVLARVGDLILLRRPDRAGP